MREDTPHTLYRLFDADDRLLYVGISAADYRHRLEKHRCKSWGKAIARVETITIPSRTEALRAEATAICDEAPLHNIAGTRDMPVPGERGVTARCPVCCSVRAVGTTGKFKAHWSASEKCPGSGVAPEKFGSAARILPNSSPRKGREGKGREQGENVTPSIRRTEVDRPVMDGGSAAGSTVLEDRVDLTDLDMLDDEYRHARCVRCNPKLKLGEPFTAACGRRAVYLNWWLGGSESIPPNACDECASMMFKPCPRCGAAS